MGELRPRDLTPAVFVGRHAELKLLLTGLDRVFERTGGMFLLSGEPGIGKTRLAEALTVEARRRARLSFQGGPLRRKVPRLIGHGCRSCARSYAIWVRRNLAVLRIALDQKVEGSNPSSPATSPAYVADPHSLETSDSINVPARRPGFGMWCASNADQTAWSRGLILPFRRKSLTTRAYAVLAAEHRRCRRRRAR